MILVICGAGASYDSVFIEQYSQAMFASDARPPLTNELFSSRSNFASLLDQFSDLRGVVVRLRSALARGVTSLEELLEDLEARAKVDRRSASQMMAIRFYLQSLTASCSRDWPEAAHGGTNYHALVNVLDEHARDHNDTVLYVTFNYDTILDLALRDEVGMQFDSIGAYVANERAKLFKLHGSCDWGRRVVLPQFGFDGIPPNVCIEHAADLRVSSEITFSKGGDAFIPALAAPVRNKNEFECPSEHLATLRQLLPSVNRLLVIGWRAMEDHFMRELQRRLSRSLPRVLVVNADPEEAKDAWMRVHRTLGTVNMAWQSTESDLGFSDLVSSDELSHFLVS